MVLSDDEAREVLRMLASFKSELPPHEIGEWLIQVEPHRVVVEDDREYGHTWLPVGFGYITGRGRCLRCSMTFNLAYKGIWIRDEGEYGDGAAKAKEMIEADAAKAGPCWGGVPHPPRENLFAVADIDAAMREP